MGIDPHWPVWRIEHLFTTNSHVYKRGDLIDVAKLMSWRNGEKLADLYYVVKEPRRSKEAVTAQRRAAGRKSREPGAEETVVRTACPVRA